MQCRKSVEEIASGVKTGPVRVIQQIEETRGDTDTFAA